MRILSVLLVCGLLPLCAQESLAFQEIPDAPRNQWAVTLGARLMSYSATPGSERNRTSLMPVFSAQYNQFYLGSSRVGVGFGGGLQLWRNPEFSWDLGLGVGDRRPESRAPELAGMGDRNLSFWVGTGLGWRRGLWHARATLAHGLADQAGSKATVALSRVFPLAPQWFATAGLHASWADAQNMAFDFGISPDQANRRTALLAGGDTRLSASELGPYAPGAGPRDLGGILALIYRPQPRLSISLGLFGGQFLGQAKDSPLVRRDSYLSAGLGFSYRLRNARPTPQD